VVKTSHRQTTRMRSRTDERLLGASEGGYAGSGEGVFDLRGDLDEGRCVARHEADGLASLDLNFQYLPQFQQTSAWMVR
jgi:hypothetical protein